MGLDIKAYSHLTHLGGHTSGFCPDEEHIPAYAYADFPQSFRGIPTLGTETHGNAEFVKGGCYARTDATETYAFKAGSYTGYGMWRSDLQKQFNPQLDPDGPFYELIWFADNEGSIGPDAARDLLADFRAHADAYNPAATYPDYMRKKYRDWTRACELAADGGLIDFH